MERLPFDIIINHILPYAYNIQCNLLLEDIKNYNLIKTIIMDDIYDIDIIKHETLAVFYFDKEKLHNILYRNFKYKLKNYNYNIIYKYSNDTRFNILFGLSTKEERIKFLEYLLEDNGIWILK